MTPRIIAANLGVRLRSFYREKSAMFFTFAFPVILVLVFGTIFTKPEHLNFDLPGAGLEPHRVVGEAARSPHRGSDVQDRAGARRRRCHAIRQGAQAEPPARDPQELRRAAEVSASTNAATPAPCR